MTPIIVRAEAIMPHQAMMMPPNCSSKQNKNFSNANAMAGKVVYLCTENRKIIAVIIYLNKV